MLSRFTRKLRGHSASFLSTAEEIMPSKTIQPLPSALVQGEVKSWADQTSTSVGPILAIWWTKDGREPSPKSGTNWEDGFTGIYFHGGGYLFGTALDRKNGFSRIPSGMLEHELCTRVLSVEYTLTNPAPNRSASFPLQLLEALSAYYYLISKLGVPPSRIMLIGDSAGGHLVLSLVRYLLESRCLERPAGVVLFSPWCDMRDRADQKVSQFLGILPSVLLENAYFSPCVHAVPSDWPPTFISSASTESLKVQIAELHDRFAQAGIATEWVKTEGLPDSMAHDFLIQRRVVEWCPEKVRVLWVRLSEWVGELSGVSVDI